MKNRENYIVKSLEGISEEVCKDMPNKKLKSKLLSATEGQIIDFHKSIKAYIGLYENKGFWPFNEKEMYATIPLRRMDLCMAGSISQSTLGDESLFKKHGIKIYSLDKKILESYKEKINKSELKNYLDKKGIGIKTFLEEPKVYNTFKQ